jgi:hypothetical protein
MPNLYDMLAEAQHGEAISALGDEFGLTPQQAQAAVTALLPAISLGLKRATATPEGLGNLLALMAQQPDLYAAYDDPAAAFSPQSRAAGNAVLATMFGSPDASRAIAAQAQRSGSGLAAPQAPQTPPDQGGGLIDILRQIFRQAPQQQGTTDQPGSSPWGIPPIGDILGPDRGGKDTPRPAPTPQMPAPREQPAPIPTDSGGDAIPGSDVLAQILRELEKGIREGRVKPVIVGPFEIDIPGRSGSSGSTPTQVPGGDILGQILRDMLGGEGRQAQLPGQAPGLGAALFGDRIEAGRAMEQSQIDSIQALLDRFVDARRG